MSMRAGDAKDGNPREALELLISRHSASARPSGSDSKLGSYRSYAEMLRAIAHLADHGARLIRCGRSARGEPLFALHFGREEALSSHALRTSVILSGVHPTEWIGIETCLVVLQRLLGADLGDRAVLAFPLVNPDGIRRVEENLRTGRRRLVRHNARGVDLNRNFDASWGNLGLVQRAFSWVFAPGSRPQSEPEVEAIAHLLSDIRVVRAVSLHSFGGAVLYPRASSIRKIHDLEEHRAWARRIAEAADPANPYQARSCARWSSGMTAGGLELDWFHERHGAISLLIECGRPRPGFRPSRWLDPFTWWNPQHFSDVASQIADGVVPFLKGLDP